MYYFYEVVPKTPNELFHQRVAEQASFAAARKLNVPRPKVRLFRIHASYAWYRSDQAKGRVCGEIGQKTLGFFQAQTLSVWVREDIGYKKLRETSAHETKHYADFWSDRPMTEAAADSFVCEMFAAEERSVLRQAGFTEADMVRLARAEQANLQAEMLRIRSARNQEAEPELSSRFLLWRRMQQAGHDPSKFSW
jgi:hypothetical protein